MLAVFFTYSVVSNLSRSPRWLATLLIKSGGKIIDVLLCIISVMETLLDIVTVLEPPVTGFFHTDALLEIDWVNSAEVGVHPIF